MRDWLTVIIVLLIVGVVLDALRRMRQARRENLQLSKNAKKADREESASAGSSEFPSGGARVAGYRDPDEVPRVNQTVKKSYQAKKVTVGAPRRIPEQVALNLDEHVPMLMDSVVAPKKEEASKPEEEEVERLHEPSLGDLDELDAIDESPEPPAEQKTEKSTQKKTDTQPDDAERAEESYRQPDEVLIINVMASAGDRFAGEALLNTLMEQGMKLGAMDIFHRHLDDDADGPVLFSLANMVVPGTFKLAQMKEFETPGVSLFLSLPLEVSAEESESIDGLSIRAYDSMAATAKALAAALDGELKDENRSVMTQQTIEHGRQRVVEYERKQRLARA